MEGCSCHINPPCGYCEAHGRCQKCDDLVLMDYMDDKGLCEDCSTEYWDQLRQDAWEDDDCDSAGGDTEL